MSPPSPPPWDALVAWLAGHGAAVAPHLAVAGTGPRRGLYTTRALAPNTRLLAIPPAALLNAATLPAIPHTRLSAVQRIALHLARHRPAGPAPDPRFGPYLATLPAHFDDHPLSALRFPPAPLTPAALLALLPPVVAAALDALAARCDADYAAVAHLLHHPPPDHRCSRDFLCAWLNVNTRCIYLRLKPDPADPDNITMCPILDMANHRARDTHLHQRAPPAPPSRELAFNSPPVHVAAGDELFLRYGPHPNHLLFVEYGFVDHSADSLQVDVHDLTQQLIAASRAASWLEACLRDAGYWGEWTLHSDTSDSAYPSFRLVTALRLYCLTDASPVTDENEDAILSPWRATILGTADTISPDNEQAWRDALREIGFTLIQRGQTKREEVQRSRGTVPSKLLADVLSLWDEEIRVAQLLIRNMDSGEQF